MIDLSFNLPLRLTFCAMAFAGVYMAIQNGYHPARRWLAIQEQSYDRVLRRQLMLDINPKIIVWITLCSVALAFLTGMLVANSILLGLILSAIMVFVPHFVIKHLEFKRLQKLEIQLVDGLTTLASGVRAGLNLVQSMQLLVENHRGAIQQEFAQILREYEMGMDLNQAMRGASNRIGSSLYRLTFTAIEMHRIRGGDSADSMDRIAESIREIQRLEGKLDAVTAQGRAQANFMAVMPIVIIIIMFVILPAHTQLLLTDPRGRMILMLAAGLIAAGYFWIKKIMQVDI